MHGGGAQSTGNGVDSVFSYLASFLPCGHVFPLKRSNCCTLFCNIFDYQPFDVDSTRLPLQRRNVTPSGTTRLS
jgi:hypothetical protein